MSKAVAVAWLLAFWFMAVTDSRYLLHRGAWFAAVLFILVPVVLSALFFAVAHFDWLYPRLPNWFTGKKGTP